MYIRPVWGVAVCATAVLVFMFYRYKAMKYFGGTTGDLSGYFLCLCEVWMVLVLAVLLGARRRLDRSGEEGDL